MFGRKLDFWVINKVFQQEISGKEHLQFKKHFLEIQILQIYNQ